MPELPEVETIRMGLEKYLVGHKILDVEVKLSRLVTGDVKNVIGATFIGVERFGKGLVIHLDNGYVLAIHIKLTGQLIYIDGNNKASQKVKVIKGTYGTLPNKWTHVIFKLKTQNSKGKSQDAYLYYNDFRQFGWIKILKEDKVAQLPFFKELGPEFFRDLTLAKFSEIVKKAKTAIKPLIMDQKKIGGVGNIYANDGLNLAKIGPQRSAKQITPDEVKRLYDALITVLKRGLKFGGASELSYVNVLGQEGSYQKHFLVYGRQGEKCFNCGGIIKKIMLGGRGTYFCPDCQR